ncbi:MAG: hypothetical protein EOP38_00180 [Rubrivivax sp.]|nr:MAG: hypothetical protein EOP38_00180 [Rubrivivax sp.]
MRIIKSLNSLFPGPVLIIGASNLALYLGAKLTAAGADVTFIGTQSASPAAHNCYLTVEECDGPRILKTNLKWAPELPQEISPALVLCCIEEEPELWARKLTAMLKPRTLVISIQSDILITKQIAFLAPSLDIVSAMAPFFVTSQRDGHLLRGSDRQIECQASPQIEPWLEPFNFAMLPLTLRSNMQNVLWGNLLFQLHEAIGIFSTLPGHQKFSQTDFRTCLADLMDEAHEIMASAGIEPSASPFSPMLISFALRLPDQLFKVLSGPLESSFQPTPLEADKAAFGLRNCNHVTALAQRQRVPAPKTKLLTKLIEARLKFKENITIGQVQKALSQC